MNRDQKATVVDEIADQIQRASAVFAVDYRGLSVAQAAALRAKLRESDTKFRIVKNSLSERAAAKAGAESLKAWFEGPTALALVHGDAALAAKALNDTARALNILEFKGGLMDGAVLSADDVRSIARLPARDVLNAQLVGTIAAPITGLVRGLNALIAGLAIQLKAIADQGLVSGEAPTAVVAKAEAAVAEGEAVAEPPAAEATEAEPVAEEGEAVAEPPAEGEAAAEESPAAARAAAEPPAEGEAAAEPDSEPELQRTDEPDQESAADDRPSSA